MLRGGNGGMLVRCMREDELRQYIIGKRVEE